MPPLVVFEENRAYVIEKFHNGHFDYIEVIQEVAQRDFFLYISNNGMLGELAESYPWPRKRQEVPLPGVQRPERVPPRHAVRSGLPSQDRTRYGIG